MEFDNFVDHPFVIRFRAGLALPKRYSKAIAEVYRDYSGAMPETKLNTSFCIAVSLESTKLLIN